MIIIMIATITKNVGDEYKTRAHGVKTTFGSFYR